jgi:predicted membrane-bound spermidine synthase
LLTGKHRHSTLRDPTSRPVVVLLLILFFTSGFAALLYQVIWQRLLTLITGMDLAAVTTIVASFMCGMGLGSVAGGQWADRMPRRWLLVTFALSEVAIAGFALGSPALYRDFFYAHLAADMESGALLLAAAITLLIPTFCMGLTLPLLARALTPSIEVASRRIGALYGWNTVGAALGAWLGTALVIRSIGYEHSLKVGALLNVVAALLSLLLVASRTDGAAPVLAKKPSSDPEALVATPLTGRPWPFGAWLATYFLSGFIALGLELVWFRLLGVLLKSTAFTFPYLLSLYLAGIGFGTLVGRHMVTRSTDPAQRFLLLQGMIPVYAALSIAAFTGLLADWDLTIIQRARAYFGANEPIAFQFDFSDLSSGQLILYLAVPVLLIVPPTLLMGMSFPLLQHSAQHELGELGRRVGRLQAANIFGSVFGVTTVGIVLLEHIGTSGTLKVFSLLGGTFFVLLAWRRWAHDAEQSPATLIGTALMTAGSIAVIPDADRLWSTLHGGSPDSVILAEGANGLSVLKGNSREFDGSTTVFVNGLAQSAIPFGRGNTYLGILPALLHPNPTEIAVIGIGSGATLFAISGRPETRSVHSIEIIGTLLDTLRDLHTRTGYGGLSSLLTDKRITYVIGDGRGYILHSRRKFDIIHADALRPTSAYAGNLYSLEYFELLRRHLKPGGYAATWSPTPRTEMTFAKIFPHVVKMRSMLVGSSEPIVFDLETIIARARNKDVQSYYRRAGIDILKLVTELTSDDRSTSRARPVAQIDLNTDLFPRDELGVR